MAGSDSSWTEAITVIVFKPRCRVSYRCLASNQRYEQLAERCNDFTEVFFCLGTNLNRNEIE